MHIHLPLTEAEITHVEGLYGRLGLPGCIGSVDCVHIPWEKCPAGLLSSCKGKEGYPTLVFEVVVSHTRKILSVSSVFFGADNDKTIARFDPAINEVRNGRYSETEWERRCYNDTRVKERGYYFICDGGYFSWKCLMSPVQNRSAGSDVDIWSKFMESVRKDVECTFGILKQRFHVLKHNVRLQNKAVIHDIFISCCILHNMLMDFDGWDDWNKYLVEDGINDIEEDNDSNHMDETDPSMELAHEITQRRSWNFEKAQFQTRREGLIEHYNYCKEKGSVRWLR